MIIFSLLSFFIIILILVFAHEFGHFSAAKLIGARVDRFSIGMGPVLWRFKKGDTEYCLSLLPIGGYVKIPGEDPQDADPDDPANLYAKPFWQRFMVFFAGSFNNIVLAFLAVAIAFFVGIREPAYLSRPPVVGWINPDSNAVHAGLQVKDTIVAVNGQPVGSWSEFLENVGISPRSAITLTIQRGHERKDVAVQPQEVESIGLGVIPIMHQVDPVIDAVSPGLPADIAGLKPGDRILAINGRPTPHWNDVSLRVRENGAQEMTLTIGRRNESITTRLTPVMQDGAAIIGIRRSEDTMIVRRYGVGQSLQQSWQRCSEWLFLSFRFLRNLVTRKASIKSVGGPVQIATFSGYVGKAVFTERLGISVFFLFLGFISLQLGVINLLPIPVLDGGHILFLFFERILGRDKVMKAKAVSQAVGIFLLLLVTAVVLVNDLLRLF